MERMSFFDEKSEAMRNGFKIFSGMIDRKIPEGTEPKFFIKVNGENYLVKDSSFNTRRKQKSLAPYCEYVGSNFIRLAGLLECQKCYLGEYIDEEVGNRPVVICKDLFGEKTFRSFKDQHQSSAGTDLSNKSYTYQEVLYVLEKKSLRNNARMKDFKSKFWYMYLFDAILGNRDRHAGNWGFVYSGGTIKIAPIFDNGASLFPDVDLTNWKNYDFIKERVFIRPGSQLKMWKPEYTDRPMRTNYWETIQLFHEEFTDELNRVKQLDCESLIKRSIIDVPLAYKEWFHAIIWFRFQCLILGRDFDEVWEEVGL